MGLKAVDVTMLSKIEMCKVSESEKDTKIECKSERATGESILEPINHTKKKYI